MKGMIKVVGIGVLVSACQICSAAAPLAEHDALALEIIEHLEVNTFLNSLRPRHYPDGTTLGDTPFRIVEKASDVKATYRAVDEERTWTYSVTVMKSAPEGVTICFGDDSLQGSYRGTSPLLVRKTPNSHYRVIKELPDTPGCPRTRG